MKKLAIIGANEFQDPLIRKAKDMGYETHVFAWAAGDVGERTADVFHPISIVEKEAVWQVCRDIGAEACCSIGSDLATHTVNYVQRRLGKPCNPVLTDTIATNKYEMRRALAAAGVPCPGFIRVGDIPDAAALRDLTFPLIVKPTDRSGSRGIFKAERPEELRQAVPAALAASFEGQAVIEEYIDGPEYSCEAISFEGKHHLLAFTKKYTTGAPHFIETGHREPADLEADVRARVWSQLERALNVLHIEYGASHAEFRLSPEGNARIIEIGARMGGDCIGSDLVYLSTGMDFTAMVIDVACGRAPDMTLKREPVPAAIRFVFTEDDRRQLRDLLRTAPETVWRWRCDEGILDGAVADSAGRRGFWITAGPAV